MGNDLTFKCFASDFVCGCNPKHPKNIPNYDDETEPLNPASTIHPIILNKYNKKRQSKSKLKSKSKSKSKLTPKLPLKQVY